MSLLSAGGLTFPLIDFYILDRHTQNINVSHVSQYTRGPLLLNIYKQNMQGCRNMIV